MSHRQATESVLQQASLRCHDPDGWGPLTRNGRVPTFTPCFEDTITAFIPSTFLLVMVALQINSLAKRDMLPSRMIRKGLYFVKLTVLILLVFTACTNVVRNFTRLQDIQTVSRVVAAFSLSAAIVVHHIEYTRNPSSAADSLVVYWLLVVAFDTAKLVNRLLVTLSLSTASLEWCLFVIQYVLSILMLILEHCPKTNPKYIRFDSEVCPESVAGLVSRLTFFWARRLMCLEAERTLALEDLWELSERHWPESIWQRLNVYWAKEKRNKCPSLCRVLTRLATKPLLLAGLVKLFRDVIQLSQPVLLWQLFDWRTENEPSLEKGVLIAAGLLLSAVSQSILKQQYYHLCADTGLIVSSALSTAIMNGAITRDTDDELQQLTVPRLLSTDTKRIVDAYQHLHTIWSVPLQAGLGLAILWQIVGPDIEAACIVLLVGMVFATLTVYILHRYKEKQKRQGQVWSENMGEMIAKIHVIKIAGFEKHYAEKLKTLHDNHIIGILKRIGLFQTIQHLLATWSTSFGACFATFALQVYRTGTFFQVDKALMILAFLVLLHPSVSVYPDALMSWVKAWEPLGRIQRFLLLPSLSAAKSRPAQGIEVNGSTFEWPHRNGTVAYIPHRPWIIDGYTLRENVVIGRPWQPAQYMRVLHMCGLTDRPFDEQHLWEERMDPTDRFRISLARACYGQPDVLFFDDPLLQTPAAQKLLLAVALGSHSVMRDAARLFVFHGLNVWYYRHLSDIRSLIWQTEHEATLISMRLSHFRPSSETYHRTWTSRVFHCQTRAIIPHGSDSSLSYSYQYPRRFKDDDDGWQEERVCCQEDDMPPDLNTEYLLPVLEDSITPCLDTPTTDSCKQYLKSYSVFNITIAFVVMVLTHATELSLYFWPIYRNRLEALELSKEEWLDIKIYTCIGIVSIVFLLLKDLIFWTCGATRSARHLHLQWLEAMLRVPLSFFGSVSPNVLARRFTSDRYAVDNRLPKLLYAFSSSLIAITFVLGVILFTTPFSAIVIIPLGFFYAMIKTNYDRVSRSLRQIRPATARRLHDLARKGIAGRWILLADEHSYEWFKEQSDTALEDYLRSYFASNICERWLALRVELIIITVLLLSCILALFVFQDLSGMMGLCLVCTLGLSDPLITFIRSHSEWEDYLNSITTTRQHLLRAAFSSEQAKCDLPLTLQNYTIDPEIPSANLTFAKSHIIGVLGPSSVSFCLGLSQKYNSITFIPQNPLLLKDMTLRDYLDPSLQCMDKDIYAALDQVSVRDKIARKKRGLDGPADAFHFKAPEKQRLWMARALLQRSNILAVHENVRHDEQLVSLLRACGCTTLIIVHKIQTAMQCDRVLVLEKGKPVEYDSPSQLLKNKESMFYALVQKSEKRRGNAHIIEPFS